MGTMHKIQPLALTNQNKLATLVENRTAYTLNQCELNVFETHRESYLVPLTFNDFVVTSMLRGKKVMHLYDKMGFDYLPGESVIVPPQVTMKIDFPEANLHNPTQCTALAIDDHHIRRTIDYLNEYFPRAGKNTSWSFNLSECHFYNNEEIAFLINKLIRICTSNDPGKDVLADLALKELVVRIMQTQSLNRQVSDKTTENGSHPMGFIIGYIKTHLQNRITIEELSGKACMSKPTFYRTFKREFGISPLEYIIREKISLSKELLTRNQELNITEVSYECGFSDVNYFVRLFKKSEGITPGRFRSLNKLPD